jgi:hypothetical protein
MRFCLDLVEVWGRRRITKEEFPWKTFPSYFNGLSYFITGNMIVPLMAAFQTVPMIPLEDVYLGICIIKADMKRYTYCGSDINSNYCFKKINYDTAGISH